MWMDAMAFENNFFYYNNVFQWLKLHFCIQNSKVWGVRCPHTSLNGYDTSDKKWLCKVTKQLLYQKSSQCWNMPYTPWPRGTDCALVYWLHENKHSITGMTRCQEWNETKASVLGQYNLLVVPLLDRDARLKIITLNTTTQHKKNPQSTGCFMAGDSLFVVILLST